MLYMLKLDKKQKDFLVKLLGDCAKLIFAILIIGQFIKKKPFNIMIFIFSTLFFIIISIVGVILSKEVN